MNSHREHIVCARAYLKCCRRAECSNQKDELSDGGTRDSSHSEMGGAFCGSDRMAKRVNPTIRRRMKIRNAQSSVFMSHFPETR